MIKMSIVNMKLTHDSILIVKIKKALHKCKAFHWSNY